MEHFIWTIQQDDKLRKAIALGHSFRSANETFFPSLSYRQVNLRCLQLQLKSPRARGGRLAAPPKHKEREKRIVWNRHMDELMRTWREHNRTYEDIARELGVTSQQCRTRAKALLLTVQERQSGKAQRRWTPDEEKRLKELRAEDQPIKDIAIALNRTEDAIHQRLKQMRDRAYKPAQEQYRPWSPEEEALLEKWGRGHVTMDWLVRQYPEVFVRRTPEQLNAKVNRMGLRPHKFADFDKELIRIIIKECPNDMPVDLALALNMPVKWVIQEMDAISLERIAEERKARPRKHPETLEELQEEMKRLGIGQGT